MTSVGSFESLRSRLGAKPRLNDDGQLEARTWLRSEVGLISPFVDWLMGLIRECIHEKAYFVELVLREALSNAVLHGNRGDARKLVKIRCCCERGRAVSIVVRDQGQGFNLKSIPNPVALENLSSGHGRRVLLMKRLMNDVSFARQGAEIHMRKKLSPEAATSLVFAKKPAVQPQRFSGERPS